MALRRPASRKLSRSVAKLQSDYRTGKGSFGFAKFLAEKNIPREKAVAAIAELYWSVGESRRNALKFAMRDIVTEYDQVKRRH